MHPDVEFHFHYEEDPHGIIHTHGIAHSPYNIYVRNIHPGKGWTVDWSIERSPRAWRTYMSKDKSHETETINKHNQLEEDYVISNKKDRPLPKSSSLQDEIQKQHALSIKWKSQRIV